MTALVTTRARRLAEALAELKVKVRAALATELAGAVGSAVRDVLVGALIDRVVSPPRTSTPTPFRGGWPRHGYARQGDSWDESRDPWVDSDDTQPHVPTRYTRDEPDEAAATEPPVAPAAALALGVSAGRWWLGRGGTGASAVGFGVLATALGLAGGPVARAALAVLAAAADVLAAESVLARPDPF